MSEFFDIPFSSALKELHSSEKGLTTEDVQKRISQYGYNELQKEEKITPFQIFLNQFNNFLIWILVAATVISMVIGEYVDASVIFAIVILNGIFGFIQDYGAEKSLEALKKLAALKAKVLRDGKIIQIDSREVVPGDILVLDTGEKIPADGRIIEEMSLDVDESTLTGESVPVSKTAEVVHKAALGDQKNMVFSSTVVTKGKGRAVVTNIGMKTEIGKIARMVQDTEEKETPLQKNVDEFGKWLGWLILIICAVVFVVSLIRNYIVTGTETGSFVLEMFMISISLAVAAIPEGLPIIVTSTLAIGVQRMVKRHALIRKLPAVETLGCTNVICSDKTGTLTKNEMTVTEIFVNNKIVLVSGAGYEPKGDFSGERGSKLNKFDVSQLLTIGVLCNDATLTKNEKWEVYGDPTEGALIVSGAKIGITKEELEKKHPRLEDIPFDSDRKLMTTVHKFNNERVAYVKGAPEMLLNDCTSINMNGKIIKLSEEEKRKIMDVNQAMAKRALRVLAFAYKPLLTAHDKSNYEKNLTFIGLQAMIDPPRLEVKEAIEKCNKAGIKSIMITGDHKLTAVAVATELGMFKKGDMVITGEELDKLPDKNFMEIVENVRIYARVSPSHKAKILGALQKKGHIVAMTGDGVNDAPALKRSDIGIAMGISGTDVAKEASDMVLTDDNFASIVNAVEEGRGIYNNIRKFIEYLLSCNIAEVLVIFISVLLGMPLPLATVQILLMNLITDGIPALALGVQPIDTNLMTKKPRNAKERIMSKPVIMQMIFVGLLITIGTLSIFVLYGQDNDKARTMAFTTIVMFQLVYVLTYAAERFSININKNKYLIIAVLFSFIVQLFIIYSPLNTHLKTVPIGLGDWLLILAVTGALYFIVELKKIITTKKALA